MRSRGNSNKISDPIQKIQNTDCKLSNVTRTQNQQTFKIPIRPAPKINGKNVIHIAPDPNAVIAYLKPQKSYTAERAKLAELNKNWRAIMCPEAESVKSDDDKWQSYVDSDEESPPSPIRPKKKWVRKKDKPKKEIPEELEPYADTDSPADYEEVDDDDDDMEFFGDRTHESSVVLNVELNHNDVASSSSSDMESSQHLKAYNQDFCGQSRKRRLKKKLDMKFHTYDVSDSDSDSDTGSSYKTRKKKIKTIKMNHHHKI